VKKYIVTTTINEPTEALIKFSKLDDWQLVVVGDLKTPHSSYNELSCVYLSPTKQEELYPELSQLLGWNTVQRRNIGFKYAYDNGCDILATVDDDNIPLDNWGENLRLKKPTIVDEYYSSNGYFDPFSPTNINHLWHRGYPIQLIKSKNDIVYLGEKTITPLIQADFVDGDPDIDAIERLLFKHNVRVNKFSNPIFSNQFSPFNSQNVFMAREVIPHYAVIPFVGRMDDIWGSYYVQNKFKGRTIYSNSSVVQIRNEHDLIVDLKMEMIGYENTLKLLNDIDNIMHYIPEESREFLDKYFKSFSS
jgi:hypothetical protein